jgi:hypothetical protein
MYVCHFVNNLNTQNNPKLVSKTTAPVVQSENREAAEQAEEGLCDGENVRNRSTDRAEDSADSPLVDLTGARKRKRRSPTRVPDHILHTPEECAILPWQRPNAFTHVSDCMLVELRKANQLAKNDEWFRPIVEVLVDSGFHICSYASSSISYVYATLIT